MSENAGPGSSGLTLLVMRHAKTEQVAQTDHVRRLTDRGRDHARAAGAWVASSGHVPDLILSSTAARAEETAQQIASMCDVRRVELVDELYGADGSEVLEIVASRTPDDVTTVMVVGHNPTMEEVASLIQPDGADEVSFPTSGIGVFGLEVESWSELEEGHGRLLAAYTRE